MMNRRFLIVAVILSIAALSSLAVGPATAAVSNTTTHIKVYANILNKVQYSLTPEDVRVTSDGGSIALAQTQSSNGTGVGWLLKLDSSGNPRWQEELGCLSLPPGSFAIGLSTQQTTDAGYIVGGGTIGCGSGAHCPASSGIECALVEKLDSTGKLSWAYAYSAGAARSVLNQTRQTSDGGYVAVGSATNAGQNTGALIVKLDSSGNVQWQRRLGPAGSTQAEFNAVQQTSDGGYVATGGVYHATASSPLTSVLAVKLAASGTVQWQRGFNSLSSNGSPTSAEHISSVIQTADGGYLAAGHWGHSNFPGECCTGALLLKLDSKGNIQWQKAYSGGVYCFENGFSETCVDIGAIIYSAHQASDGGYVLAGAGNLKLADSVPQVPWLAKVDSAGNLVGQHFYYQEHRVTNRPLSQYFASSTLTQDGGPLALGFTENESNGKGELYGVKTDSAGLVGVCSQVHDATPLNAINPELTSFAPSLPLDTTIGPRSPSPSSTLATSVTTQSKC
jgi:hypothetical protein